MTDDRLAHPPARTGGPATTTAGQRSQPERPPRLNPNTAPVITKETPPFSVRVSFLMWVLSLFAGGISIVYYFVIRQEQLPLIHAAVRAVDPSRAERTYTTAADIIYWGGFWLMVGLLVAQITLLVSFTNRRDHARWWQLGTFLGQAVLFGLALELVMHGTKGAVVAQLLATQCLLVLLALLTSTLPGAMAWTARKHDVRRRTLGAAGGDL